MFFRRLNSNFCGSISIFLSSAVCAQSVLGKFTKFTGFFAWKYSPIMGLTDITDLKNNTDASCSYKMLKLHALSVFVVWGSAWVIFVQCIKMAKSCKFPEGRAKTTKHNLSCLLFFVLFKMGYAVFENSDERNPKKI